MTAIDPLPAPSAAFSFIPTDGSVRSPAYSLAFKTMAVLIVTAAVLWGAQLWSNGQIALTLRSSGWLLAALAMMVYTEWHILRGTTTLDSTALLQTWVWNKRVTISDLAYARLMRVKGLDWLIAPRLYTRTFSNKLTVFYAASPQMLVEFERLALELKAARESR